MKKRHTNRSNKPVNDQHSHTAEYHKLNEPMCFHWRAQSPPEGRSAVGNHKWTTTWWWGPTVNIRPALPQAVIAMLCNYTRQTSNYRHNEANYYSACERRMSREHSGNLLPLLCWWKQLLCPRQKNPSVKHAAYKQSHNTNNRRNCSSDRLIDC